MDGGGDAERVHVGEALADDGSEEGDYSLADFFQALEDEHAEELETALAAPETDSQDPYYFVRSRKAQRGDIYSACRVGDLERVRHLVENDGVDVNLRDRWDSVPLYYSCLAGHRDVVDYLLEAGATCNEFTFDGDRCHYAALNTGIRALLSQHEQRPPPLAPLAADIRGLATFLTDGQAPEPGPPPFADLVFVLGSDRIPVQRCVLAARSPFFRRAMRRTWLPREPGLPREVHLRPSAALPAGILRAVLAFVYTERLDVPMEDVDAVLRVVRRCRLRATEAAIVKEKRTLKYYFKSTRRDEAPRRFVLQPGALPGEARLGADLGRLRRWAGVLEARHEASAGPDFADLVLAARGRLFRCHRCILAARSEYFRALLRHADLDEPPGPSDCKPTALAAACPAPNTASYVPAVASVRGSDLSQMPGVEAGAGSARPAGPTGQGALGPRDRDREGLLPSLTVTDVAPAVMEVMLRFMYTGAVGQLPRGFMTAAGAATLFEAADRYLLLPMKREVGEAMVGAWSGAPPALEPLCRLLLAADEFGVAPLRDACLHGLAAAFERVTAAAAPRRERRLFEAFVAAIAPKDADDIWDGSSVPGASLGNIEGGGLGGKGVGTLLQDIREAYLEDYGEEAGRRDEYAQRFDSRMEAIAARVLAAQG